MVRLVSPLWSLLFVYRCVNLSSCSQDLNASLLVHLSDSPVVSPGRPLLLTPYLKINRTAEAKAAAFSLLLPGVDSYSGFFTVDDRYESNMFFWFFPSQKNDTDDPLVLWLQGGPGYSSIISIFTENGPLLLDDSNHLKSNPKYWAKDMNLIYIDNPVGVGFSFTSSRLGYTNDTETVGRNLYSAMSQFFQLFPEYLKHDFFITGSSYGGKFVTALGYTIHANNPTASMKMNLKGLAIGNGWVDPVNQLGYPEYLYNIGLIDIETKEEFVKLENHIRSLIESKSHEEASSTLLKYIAGGFSSYFRKVTGLKSTQNYIHDLPEGSSFVNAADYLETPEILRKIHAGDQPFWGMNVTVFKAFRSDRTRSVAPWLEILMDHYRVLIYNGQLDVICPYPLTINYVRRLKWEGAGEYLAATRHQWHVDGELAGYAKSARNFTEVLVRNAGHDVTVDQPLWARDMMKKFTRSLPFGSSL